MKLTNIPFLKRLIPSIYRRYRILINPIIKNFILDNIIIDIDLRESLERKIFFEKEYEENNFSFLKKNIEKYNCNIFIDIGSNIGIYTLRLAKFKKIKEIYSFEPLEDTFNKLKSNITKNKLNNKINSFNFGLSSKTKELQGLLRKKGPLKQSAGFRIDKKGNKNILVKKGDDILKFSKKSICIKCDVEGHEYDSLLGLRNLLLNNKCFIQIEIWEKNKNLLTQYFEDMGYYIINNIDGETYFTNF